MTDLLPYSWPLESLKSLSSLITKGTTPTSYGHSYNSNGINFFRVENISLNGELVEDDRKFIDAEADEDLKRSRLHLSLIHI